MKSKYHNQPRFKQQDGTKKSKDVFKRNKI